MEVEFWKNARQSYPVKDFIESELQQREKDKVSEALDRVERNSTDNLIRSQLLAPLKGYKGLYELRIRLKGIFIRIFCQLKNNKCYLLHAFKKKSNDTPRNQIEKAFARMIGG